MQLGLLTIFFNKVNSFSRGEGKSEAAGEGRELKSLSWCEVSCEEQVPTGPHISNSFFRLNLPSQFTIKHIILLALIFLPHSAASLCSTKAAKKKGKTAVRGSGARGPCGSLFSSGRRSTSGVMVRLGMGLNRSRINLS